MVMLSCVPATVAAGARLRGAAEAGVVRAAALNAASRAAVIIDVRKERLLSCRHRKRRRFWKLHRRWMVPAVGHELVKLGRRLRIRWGTIRPARLMRRRLSCRRC